MNKNIILGSLVVVALVGGALLLKGSPSTDGSAQINDQIEESSVKEFVVTGAANFTFAPNMMSVKKGDTVKITFKNAGGFHDLVIDEYGVATKQLQAGQEETITFVADKVGNFEYYCSVGSHRKMGMKGTLVVEE